MIIDILKGFVIGATAAMPVGPIAILVIQKTMGKGRQAGFVTGLGASVVDTIYAIVALFALAFAQQLIDRHENLILLVGGTILSLIGVSMVLSNPFRKRQPAKGVFVMFTLFAFFGLAENTPRDWNVAPIICSVSAGSVTYWFTMSWILSRFREKFRLRTLLWISRTMGAIVIIIGLVLLGEGLFNVVFLSKPLI